MDLSGTVFTFLAYKLLPVRHTVLVFMLRGLPSVKTKNLTNSPAGDMTCVFVLAGYIQRTIEEIKSCFSGKQIVS